ncbi:hypothetical protein JCM10207_002867 [Rhodosporidiobolus poonsookiae]
MPSLFNLIAASAVASSALAHVAINYPTSSWNFTEEQQEEGGFCGGGSRVAGVAFGTENGFISLSGDEGATVRVLLASSNSATENTTVSSASDFPIVLSEGATFSSSGNLCLPLNLPTNYTAGAHATIYVAAVDGSETVSSCAEVNLVPADTSSATVYSHNSPVVNPAGGNYTNYDYYCSNSTIAALDTCGSCHCHGDHAHCPDTCSAEGVEAANAQCAGTATSSDSHDDHSHDDHSHSSTASEEPSRTAEGAVAPSATGGGNGAGRTSAAAGVAAALALVAGVFLQ